MIRIRCVLWLNVALILSVGAARADSVTLLSVSGTSASSQFNQISSGFGDDPEFHGVSFILTQSFSGVSISVPSLIGTGLGTFTAWLTDAIGPAATSSNVIVSSTLTACTALSCGAPASGGDIEFFSNLNLSPGTYYFILSTPNLTISPTNETFARFATYSDPTVSAASNVQANGEIDTVCPISDINCAAMDQSFPPASSWNVSSDNISSFLVTSSAAEPGSLTPFLCGLSLLVCLALKVNKIRACTKQD